MAKAPKTEKLWRIGAKKRRNKPYPLNHKKKLGPKERSA